MTVLSLPRFLPSFCADNPEQYLKQSGSEVDKANKLLCGSSQTNLVIFITDPRVTSNDSYWATWCILGFN